MISQLIASAREYLPDLNKERLVSAFDFARKAHSGQLRKDGAEYIIHPVKAAEILTTFQVDEDSLIACLLHDVPEDTEHTIEEIESLFGENVAFLVNGITKLSKVHYRDMMEARQIESLKKLFIHCAEDPRVILIKLADRMHNMSTIDALPPEKRNRIARETLEIYVPIANMLGIWELKNSLEDYCFKVLEPKHYAKIDALVLKSEVEQRMLVKRSISATEELLNKAKVGFVRVEGRRKNHYGIYKKMKMSRNSFHDIYDLVGLRIILDDISTCYQILGILHQNFLPKLGRLKDYIALPKSNGYQSLHTTVFGLDGKITEFQIRTGDMHIENEYGIAAHYFYREAQMTKQKNIKKKLSKKYEWVKQILDLQKDVRSNKRFMRNLKLDIFKDRIFVFTPNGDVVDLPQGAVVIDFAYHIHSDVGMLAEFANINGQKKSLFSKLHNGDVIHVKTSESAEGPQIKWLNAVQTNLARTRIREFLREKDKHELLIAGENLFDKELKYYDIQGAKSLTKDQKMMLLEHFEVDDWENFLVAVGHGEIDIPSIVFALFADRYNTNRSRGEDRLPGDDELALCIHVRDRVGLLGDIGVLVAELDINMLEMHTYPVEHSGEHKIKICIRFGNLEQYIKLLRSLNCMPEVIAVNRLETLEEVQTF
ncbi:bifunctional (p)ppGpp synthetase/guanosine-3',5'-bis(diphosphate) 3'-pyrophosphohydrolase [Candidatus Peregrinibacteria bacterium]|jgi:GTP diphosphokinase / guanosine-3',5'-bis(diphosphate) 3'-diphosphatase|nr:bifunctional (p)ppGpp synthetase/guanosine-3',5'-bis(diphosphate) 3'-pyrophosphohydrolase [Candidatus Peregrinibacteria bacterium]